MICYKCGSTLGSGRHCLHCGADVSMYRRIVKISNAYYNAGLEKAQFRNLSGAIEDLTRALEFNKRNTDARTLLGLVYFEVGEAVEALIQWVIANSLDPEDGRAAAYLEKVRGDAHSLDRMTQAIRKFNIALDTARHDGEDVAMIQLRKILSQHPKFLKAYELLALLLIRDEDYSKAGKLLKKALAIDVGNPVCQRYQSELKGRMSHPKKRSPLTPEQQHELEVTDAIVPEYRERPRILSALLGAAAGVVVCLAAWFALIRPSIAANLNERVNKNQISYNEQMEDKDAELVRLQGELDKATGELESNNRQMELFTGANGSLTNYDKMIRAMQYYKNADWDNMITTYAQVDPETINSEIFQSFYSELGEFIHGDELLSLITKTAIETFQAGNYAECRVICQKVLDLDPNHVEAIYYMALAYEAGGDDRSAAPYFQDIVNRFPDSEYYARAKARVS